ncbi:phosphate/phosphite/phosphonate ABC transporter substrate-binding protein [Motilimonas pumila]|uniref:Phosphate/phosphite/phosphonate ABC transporter substrate-binding protein n=1 Tax=Motilimonas pumila TaxID=2303987 RepID=A0A418YD50_9GAMM|nr:phosphate/phosphite/phosphonate ABC transporter substrate-binding protein [Motilimonas pumila]RJG42458.1 phosphate/phosphite/phosphonate ABC transporter substrate-binding protein [Motilimonas pumila]
MNRLTRLPATYVALCFFWLCAATQAQTSPANASTSLTFGIVPQQSASKLVKRWGPLLQQLSLHSGVDIRFATAPDIPTFEQRLSQGQYDIAYMNPYHYVEFHQRVGYNAIAKAKDKQIKGIIVVPKNAAINELSDLQQQTLAFPSPAAFAATIITQAALRQHKVDFDVAYVSSHDSVYRAVAKGLYPAGGGVIRTFNNTEKNVKDKLTVLYTSLGYTPHAIATHPRLAPEIQSKLQQALVNLSNTGEGQQALKNLSIKGFSQAQNQDWDDIRSLNLPQLEP